MPENANVLKLEFENGIVIFEVNTLEFVYLKNLAKKQKRVNLDSKMCYLGIIGREFGNIVVISEISPPQFCLFAKFDQKTKMPRFRTRNA